MSCEFINTTLSRIKLGTIRKITWRRKYYGANRWDPFSELGPFREDLGRLFDKYSNLIGQGWQPAVDLLEDDEAFTLKAEIPGVEA